MKKLYFFRLVLILFLCTGIHGIMPAQNFNLTDINKITNSFPRNDEFSAKNAFIYFNGSNYFTADDGIHGQRTMEDRWNQRRYKNGKGCKPRNSFI